MKAVPKEVQAAAEALAIQALTHIAGDPERMGRFLAVTGIGPTEIRSAAGEPGFLGIPVRRLVGPDAVTA